MLKCKYCKLPISEDELGVYPQLDRKRQVKYKKNTKGEFKLDADGNKIVTTFNAHKKCHEDREKERMAWEKVYEYVKEKCFGKVVPSAFITRAMDLRNGSSRMGRVIAKKEGYSYEIIYKVFEEYEDEIVTYVSSKEFNNDSQRANYVMAIVENLLKTRYDNI